MTGILTGFAVVAGAVLTGYLIGRIDLLGEHGRYVLSRLCFFVLTPFLLFTVLARADLSILFSSLLPVSAVTAVAMFVVYALVARLAWKRTWGDITIGAFGSGYINANNIGIPISTYVLGNGAYSAPVLLVQLLVFVPVALMILDSASAGGASLGRVMRRTLHNPMIIGAVLGVLVALLPFDLPDLVMEPFALVAGAAVPVLLISFGMSLHGQRVLTQRGTRRDVLLATGLKLLVMPLAAYALGHFAFGLDGHALFAVVILAALPTAQNVFNYAQRYGIGEVVARDVIFLTTLGCIPVVLGWAMLLG